MRAQILVVTIAAAAASACACGKKQSTGGGGAGRDAPIAELIPPPPLGLDGGAPDEDAVRSGRRTGMANDLPQVATEPLVQALVDGRTPWTRFVDARAGVVELRRAPPPAPAEGAAPSAPATVRSGRRCGAEVEQTLAEHATAITESLRRTELGYTLTCDNLALAVLDPDGAAPHAICSVESPAAYALGHDLIFVPDPVLGLRLAGISMIDGAEGSDELLDQFSAELGQTGAPCP